MPVFFPLLWRHNLRNQVVRDRLIFNEYGIAQRRRHLRTKNEQYVNIGVLPFETGKNLDKRLKKGYKYV